MDNVLKSIAAKESQALQFLERLVNIDSGIDNPDGIAEVAHIIGDRLLTMGFTVEYIEHPGICTHVLARKKGTTGNTPVMITGHMDTVFPRGTAAARPFTIKGEMAYGPGVLDMKGGITTALTALEALYESGWNDKDITVFFCGDEETGHPHTDAVDYFKKVAAGQAAVFNMESGRPDGAVVIGRKGGIKPVVEIEGKTAHAGNEPEKGANALLEMVYKLADIQKITDKERGISVNVGVIRGGVADNVVPAEAIAKIDIRFSKVDDADGILNALREIAAKNYVAGTKTVLKGDRIVYIPMETTAGGQKLFELVQAKGRQLGIPEIGGMVVGASSDSCWTTIAGAPTVCSMGPRGGLNHSEREYIFVDGLVERAKLLALCLTEKL